MNTHFVKPLIEHNLRLIVKIQRKTSSHILVILQFCYRIAFYLYFYSFLFAIAQRTSSSTTLSVLGCKPLLGLFYSILVSRPTRYGATDSLISIVTSGLASQPSPILVCNHLSDFSYRRQYSKYFSYFLCRLIIELL